MSDVTITPRRNGPLIVTGEIQIVTPGGRLLSPPDGPIRLCRCGGSSNKPFCDSTHRKNGFASDVDAEVVDLTDFVDICAVSDIPAGELKGVRVGGAPVVIGNVHGTLAAIGGVCSHEEALLEDGELDGNTVRCPLHDSGFDIHTGKAVRLPATSAVPAYDVKVEDGRVYISKEPRKQ